MLINFGSDFDMKMTFKFFPVAAQLYPEVIHQANAASDFRGRALFELPVTNCHRVQ